MMLRIIVSLISLLVCTTVFSQDVRYQIDGQDYLGYWLSPTSNNQHKTIVLVHDWDGLTAYEKQRAELLQAQGYAVFALDVYGEGNRPSELADKQKLSGALLQDRGLLRQRLQAGMQQAQQLAQQPLVLLGYCFGGTAILEQARANNQPQVIAYASFHGALAIPEQQSYQGVQQPLFIAHGGADSAVPLQDVFTLASALELSKTPYQLHVYAGAPHAFTVFGSDRYQPQADQQSWLHLLQFLQQLP